jgi:hypothetical protein
MYWVTEKSDDRVNREKKTSPDLLSRGSEKK